MKKRNITLRSRDELEAFYRRIIPKLQAEARECGYALAVHGSLRRDLDLIAVPWVKKYRSPNVLALRLMKLAGGMTYGRNWVYKSWTEKPNGRRSISLILCRPWVHIKGKGVPRKKEVHGAYLDLSIK